MKNFRAGLMASAFILAGAVSALAGTLVINTDTSDPAPKKAMQALIDGFKAKNPGVDVKWNVFDHEGYKSAIRNFLTADPPDIVSWYAGNRMAPFVKAGLFADVSDVWKAQGFDKTLGSALSAMTIDGKQWGVPQSYYQWGIYYRSDIFKKLGIATPKTWDELLAACATLKKNGITPFSLGSKALWPTAGWFDYLDLRVNGYAFHMDLTNGKIPWTDPRVKAVFAKWDDMVKNGYIMADHPAFDWQEAVPQMVQGKTAMYVMGNFAVAVMEQGGLKADQIDFMPFPTITPGLPPAEEAPIDSFHIPAKAKDMADAKKFLAYLGSGEAQTKINDILGQLPISTDAKVGDDKFLKAGLAVLSKAQGVAQFFDRDAPADMAKIGMEGFQEFLVHPDHLDAILARLEA
ncbi:MAG: extracellular solute-binding protein, partial [Hyphomicrobiales bacterium]|nr:extracellular solute-binding protein [Hyphomicrobiales bacterium]